MRTIKKKTTTNLYTDGTTAEIVAAIPTLTIPAAKSFHLRQQRIVIVGGSIGGLAAAACLFAAGFVNVQVVEKSKHQVEGAGIGLDDVSVGILKGLGLELGSFSDNEDATEEHKETSSKDVTVQRMRWAEERVVNSHGTDKPRILSQQPFPYSAVRYAELTQGLEKAATVVYPPSMIESERVVQRGMKAVEIVDNLKANDLRVEVVELATHNDQSLECDLVIVADGPHSRFRKQVIDPEAASLDNSDSESDSDDDSDDEDDKKDDLRFAGYTAWRGTVPESQLPEDVRAALRKEYPRFSNCLYFVWGPMGKSAVLYDIGNGLVNWLVYECCDAPRAPPGRTTTTATAQDIAKFRQSAKAEWGPALGAVMEHTPNPFQNDTYDIDTPLESFSNANNTLCLLGDAAHPITPHCAKGSNLAIQDAFVLACAAEHATSIQELLQLYNERRVADCRNMVLLSRHFGRMRNGMPPMTPTTGVLLSQEPWPRPPDAMTFQIDVNTLTGLPTATLPTCRPMEPAWQFMQQHIPPCDRGFWLQRASTCNDTASWDYDASTTATEATSSSDDNNNTSSYKPPVLEIVEVNHISLETQQVDRLVAFYQNVLGLPSLPRPNFGFGGAWLRLPGGQALHIIERDPDKPGANGSRGPPKAPERFIRRSHHVALTVLDIEAAKATLKMHGIVFAINQVPDTAIEQLFLYDPDGNGIEIGNFNA